MKCIIYAEGLKMKYTCRYMKYLPTFVAETKKTVAIENSNKAKIITVNLIMP